MDENETTIDNTAQMQSEPQQAPTPTQTNPQPESTLPPTPPKQPETSKLLNKNKIIYSLLAVIIIALIIVAATSFNNNVKPKNTTTSQTIANITVQTTTPQNSSPSLSSIPLESNMSDYYNYTSNVTTIDQYGLPFTKDLILSSALPSNYTLKVPQTYANITSPIMVFINISSYPNVSSAQSNYRAIAKSIANITISNINSINNSAVYSTNTYGLSLIGAVFQYQKYIMTTITWGNPKIFINSSYASNIAEKQYSILNSKTQ